MADSENPTTENDKVQNTPKQDRASFFMGDLDKKLKDEGVELAVILIIDPKSSQPLMMTKGSPYNLASASVSLARHFKLMVDKELSV